MYVFESTPGYFAAMGIRLLRGRLFDARDDANRPQVAIINESLARRFFPDVDPIGKRMGPAGHPERGGAIVGVVADVRDGRISGFSGEAPNQVYVPLAQNPYDVLTFVVRPATGMRDGLGPALRAAIRDVDPDQPIGPAAAAVGLGRRFGRPPAPGDAPVRACSRPPRCCSPPWASTA